MFSATTAAVTPIATLLRALAPVGHMATVSLTPNGVLVRVVDKSQTCSAHTLLLSSLFAPYRLQEPQTLNVSLRALVDALSLYGDWIQVGPVGGSTAGVTARGAPPGGPTPGAHAVLQYDPEGPHSAYLQILCGSDAVRSRCDLQIYDVPHAHDTGPRIDKQNIVLQVIFAGSRFAEIVRVLERVGAAHFRIVGHVAPVWAVEFGGASQGSTTLFRHSEQSSDALVVESAFEFHYSFESVLRLRDALRATTKMNVRCDVWGALNVQMIHEVEGVECVVDYVLAPTEP